MTHSWKGRGDDEKPERTKHRHWNMLQSPTNTQSSVVSKNLLSDLLNERDRKLTCGSISMRRCGFGRMTSSRDGNSVSGSGLWRVVVFCLGPASLAPFLKQRRDWRDWCVMREPFDSKQRSTEQWVRAGGQFLWSVAARTTLARPFMTLDVPLTSLALGHDLRGGRSGGRRGWRRIIFQTEWSCTTPSTCRALAFNES